MVLTQKQKDNFWSKVEKTDSCWNWTGYTAFGYGKVNLKGVVYLAHRISVLLDGRAITAIKREKGAAGEIVMHTCDNRKCVNPDHLKVATQKENMMDAKNKGRKWGGELGGEANPNSKLNKQQVAEIRNSSERAVLLAERFGIGRSQVYFIKNNRSWITL